MHEETVGSKVVKWLLIGISALFLIVMLLLPLITVISEALRSGWETYLKAVTDRYTIKAIFLTLEATICAVLINTISAYLLHGQLQSSILKERNC